MSLEIPASVQDLPTEPNNQITLPSIGGPQSKLANKAYNFKIPLKTHSLEPISSKMNKPSKEEFRPKAAYLVAPQPNKRKVMTRIRNFYYMKYPSFNVKKYMNPEITLVNDDPNLFYTDEEAIERMSISRQKQRQRKLERFNHVTSKVDSGLRASINKSVNETAPVNKGPNDSKDSDADSSRVINLFSSPSRIRVYTNPNEPQKVTPGPFLTQQQVCQTSPDRFDTSETSPTVDPQKAPLKSLNSMAIKALTHFLSKANKSSKKSLDQASEFSHDESQLAGPIGQDKQKNHIPRQYQVNDNAQFNYYYQRYKDPVIRSKLPSKKKGIGNEISYQNQLGAVFTRNKLQTIREANVSNLQSKGYVSPSLGAFQSGNMSFDERSRRADSLTKRAETQNYTTTENSIEYTDYSRLNTTSFGGGYDKKDYYYNVEDESKRKKNKKLPSIYDQYKDVIKAVLATDISPKTSKRYRSKSRSPSPTRRDQTS